MSDPDASPQGDGNRIKDDGVAFGAVLDGAGGVGTEDGAPDVEEVRVAADRAEVCGQKIAYRRLEDHQHDKLASVTRDEKIAQGPNAHARSEGHAQARNFFEIVAYLQKKEGLRLRVRAT